MTDRPTFDLAGSLPQRATIVEASAGTGKTYAIVGLVARFVAAGVDLDDLLVVTFTRAATAELRSRVRARLEETLRTVSAVPDDPQRPLLREADQQDAVVAAILRDEVPSVAAERLRTALSDVDGAAITTIHSFCQHALDGLGLAVGLDRDAELTDQDHELVAGIVDDLLVRRYAGRGADEVVVPRRKALEVGLQVVNQPHAPVFPTPAEGMDPETAEYHWVATEVRAELARRKAAGRWMSYDDLLTRLRDALHDPRSGGEVIRGLRDRYPVVLVDEFQDTDPVQWDILRTAFGDAPLTLVGDPKQAIYSFRGADVDAYLDAVAHVGDDGTWTLTTNRRSDVRLLAAFNRLMEDASLGTDIRYRQVQAPDATTPARLRGAKPDVPLRLRLIRGDNPELPPKPAVTQLRDVVARDLAGEVTQLLAQGATLVEDTGERNVEPGDVAVLVRTNDQAARIQQGLLDVGVSAVINGAGSVFETVAASEWLWLLAALDAPHDEGRARAAALTSLVGWSAADLEAADEHAWQRLHDLLHDLSAHVRATSPAALWRTLGARCRVGERLLARTGGERRLTDLAHVADLLHDEATRGGRGARDLSTWLREQMARDEQGVAPDERARRLESDADAVQVVTIHRSKGLEFPIVYCPYLWSSSGNWQWPYVGRVDGERVVQLARGDEGKDVKDAQERESAEEELRLLYVALTRARHQVVLWWAPFQNARYAPLSRMLFCRRGGTGAAMTTCRQGSPPKTDDGVVERLHDIFGEDGELIAIESVARPTEPIPVPERGTTGVTLAAEEIASHRVDRSWRRTSYTALTARAHGPTTERESTVTDDEVLDDVSGAARDGSGATRQGRATVGGPQEPADRVHPVVGPVDGSGTGTPGDDEGLLRGTSLPLGDLPGGTRFGTYVHALLEHLDFTAPDPVEATARAAAALRARSPLDVAQGSTLHSGLARALGTPLGPVADDLALADVGRGDRLDEMTFELPLAGGGAGRASVSVRGIAGLLRRHAERDPLLAAYLPAVADPSFAAGVRGYLTGSLDLTLRIRGSRFLVVDYKTNRLTPWDAEPSAWDYRPDALVAAMCRGHYPLQALLYLVALHRYLRWRLSGYDPTQHLGGAAYLFVRGMVGPESPRSRVGPWAGTPTGVMPWRPDPVLIEDVSTLLDRGEAA